MQSAVLKTGDIVQPDDFEALENLPVGSAIAITNHEHSIWQKICQYLDPKYGICDTWRTPTGEERPSEALDYTTDTYQIIYLPGEQEPQQ